MELIAEYFQGVLLAIVVMSFVFVSYLEVAERLHEERVRPTKYLTLEFVYHQREIHTVILKRDNWFLPKTEVYRKIRNKFGEEVFVNELNEEVDLACILPTKIELL